MSSEVQNACKKTWQAPVIEVIDMVDTSSKGDANNESMQMQDRTGQGVS